MQDIIHMWEFYDSVVESYRNTPPPQFLDLKHFHLSDTIETRKSILEHNREIQKKNNEISEIIYIINHADKINNTIKYLMDTFDFSESEIKENISFYDALFNLAFEDIFDKTTFFINLFGSKELFLTAMHTGTPMSSIDEDTSRSFRGIMSYKKHSLFEKKMTSLSILLCLSKEETAKIFVSNYRYMYCSVQTMMNAIYERCEVLEITPEDYGKILQKFPDFLPSKKDIKDTVQYIIDCYESSKEEALHVICSCPNIVLSPNSCFDNIADGVNTDLSPAILSRPWLYKLYVGGMLLSRYYGYNNFDTILHLLSCIENDIGIIFDVKLKSVPRPIKVGLRDINEILYAIILAKKPNGEICFITLGSGYCTNNNYSQTPENRLLKNIFGINFYAELIVTLPSINYPEYDNWLKYLFAMSVTGNTIPCVCKLSSGTSIVVEELETPIEFHIDKLSCTFRTIKVISSNEVEAYTSKHIKSQTSVENVNDEDDELDLDDWEDEEYFHEDYCDKNETTEGIVK